ncbi:MAG: isopentenyl phosphate kinase family protein [Candidatus Bathyarchaeum sp.]|nr:MAG: isopentenyl phosphate kinase family protein [Candidatus Bathyarchaeum sp.]
MMVREMNGKPIVLKLGGSVITNKKKPSTPNLRAIERLANEISQAKISSLILVHGGGSFGHPVAERYSLAEGFRDRSQVMGFSETHRAMTELNSLVMEALISHNIPAVEVQPSSCVVTKAGRITNMELNPLKKMLKMGFVPVLYGDAVLDSEKGFAILSGDQLVSSLAITLDAKRIIMGVDEDGLYTADPKTDPSAHLIDQITLEELKSLKHTIEGSKATDVTGGMLRKIIELTLAIEQDIQTLIVNATKSQRVYKALKGEKVIGTIIKKG